MANTISTGTYSPNGGPHPQVMMNGVKVSPSSFGLDGTTLGQSFPATQIFNSARGGMLQFRGNYFKCTQHDWKMYDFQGRLRRPGGIQISGTQPLLSSSSQPDTYVHLDQRRPSAPYRLARKIVNSFTNMVFGQGRWPSVVSDDPDTQEFCEALIKEIKLQSKMIRTRNAGGSCGTVGMSWWFNNGTPRVRIHQAHQLFVAEWEDEDEFIPAHVIQLYQFERYETNPKTGKPERVFYWNRRDWTPKADVVFYPVKVDKEDPHQWEVDFEKSCIHDDGFCHFVWIQNLPIEETEDIDGQSDYAEVYEQLDCLDVLNSVHVKGTTVNLDPTLVLGMYADQLGDAMVQKGSDHALAVGEQGSAAYLTIGSDVVNAGEAAVQSQRGEILETTECVIPDPNTIAAAGTSSVALKMVYAPMLGKSDILRDQYGEAIIRLLEQMLRTARALYPKLDADTDEEKYIHEAKMYDDGSPVLNEEGEPELEQVEYVINLPPKIEKVEIVDAEGKPTGEFNTVETEHIPGNGRISLDWPDYFKKTSLDKQQEVGSLTTANGGRPVMSQKTSVEQYAHVTGRDAQEEFATLRDEQASERQANLGMFPEMGGQVDVMNDLPDGAKELDVVDENIVTMNEARVSKGLEPLMLEDGSPDPDGLLTVVAYKAKQTAKQTQEGDVEGQVAAQQKVAEEQAVTPTPEVTGGEQG